MASINRSPRDANSLRPSSLVLGLSLGCLSSLPGTMAPKPSLLGYKNTGLILAAIPARRRSSGDPAGSDPEDKSIRRGSVLVDSDS